MRCRLALAAVAAVLGLTGCGTTGPGAGDLPKAFRSLVPSDTKVLADVRMDKLKSTALYQRHQQDLAIPLLDSSSERIGIDPRRDLSEILVAWNGKNALVLVRGTFDSTVVTQKLTALKAPQTTYKGHTVFGEAKNSVAFVSKDLAVVGSAPDVQRTLDLAGGDADTVPAELKERLRQIPKSDQIWIVSNGLPFVDAPMRSDVQSALSNITNYVSGANVGVMVDTGTHLKIDLTCISEEGAKRVHDALRGAIGLGRLSTRDDQQELMQVYDAINVDQDKALVHVHADYSGALTDKLFEQLGQINKAVRR